MSKSTDLAYLIVTTDEALVALHDALNDYAWGGGFTCAEADELVELYRVWGRADLAQQLYNGHVQSDSEGDRHFDDIAAILATTKRAP
jgi:hypothetical protein